MPRPNTGPRLKWIDKRRSFYIVWYEAGRERIRSTGTQHGPTAEAALEEFIRERRARAAPRGPRDPGQFPIADALDLYGRTKGAEAKDPARIAYAIDALLPFWGENMVADITEEACKRYTRERDRAPATMRRELTVLRAAVNYAKKAGHLTTAPFVWLPEKPDGKDRWLTKGEAARLLNAARTGRSDVRLYLPLFILIGLYTGARKGAILSLRWPQIDFERERINFAPKGYQRTSKGRARLPIPRQLMTFLRLAWRRRMSDVGFVIHDKGRPIKDIGEGRHGSFGSAVKRAGLEEVTPHTLRHTCGTWLAHDGVDLWEIGGWLGQTHATTTELYAHHHPDHLDRAKRSAERQR